MHIAQFPEAFSYIIHCFNRLSLNRKKRNNLTNRYKKNIKTDYRKKMGFCNAKINGLQQKKYFCFCHIYICNINTS